jgi:NitT/TauT family transport system substrate-binding protein
MGLDSWIGGTPIIYGLAKDIDKKYLLRVGIENLSDEKTKMLGLKEGKFQVVEIALPLFLNMQKEYPGCGIIVGITDFSYGADGLIAKSEIRDLSKIRGKKIAYMSDEISKYSLYQFLKKANLKYQDIQPMEYSRYEDMMEVINNGSADAVIAADESLFTILNYINSKKLDSFKLLSSSRDIPDFMPNVLVFNNDFAEKNPKKGNDFLKIWFDSVKKIMSDSGKSYTDIFEISKKYPDIYGDVTEDDLKQSLSGIKLMSLNGNLEYFGINGKNAKLSAVITDTVSLMQDSRSLSKEAEAANILSGTFLESIFKENKSKK